MTDGKVVSGGGGAGRLWPIGQFCLDINTKRQEKALGSPMTPDLVASNCPLTTGKRGASGPGLTPAEHA